ncbi:protein NEN3 [Pyrus x bretschneideri]|uniref:protein NEN3 n=1 Tax=Pyrus x bretschneideri TaxID=225117 RepID=UPI00202EAD8D|nr:protein NEN3 [Pyrus x bretschneideri]
MQSLATYFRLGDQPHRSLGDVRMNLEVLKCCAAVLYLESSLPDIFKKNSWVPSNANTRICSENTERVSNVVESSTARPYAFDMDPLRDEVMQEPNQPDNAMVEVPKQKSVESSSPIAALGSSHGTMEFLQPDEVSIPSIHSTLVPLDNGSQRIKLLHKDETLQLCYRHMELRFGINGKYFDRAGRPQLNIICYAPQNLCRVLDACDGIVQKDSGSSSEWKPAVIQKDRTYTVKLHIKHTTEIYQKEPCGAERRLVTKFDASELSTHLKPRTFIDAFFSLEPYDYQQSAGIRSVAKKLILLSN